MEIKDDAQGTCTDAQPNKKTSKIISKMKLNKQIVTENTQILFLKLKNTITKSIQMLNYRVG